MVQPSNWDADIKKTAEEEYYSLLRALRRTQDFGIIFVECAPALGEKIIEQLKKDLPNKKIDIFALQQPIEKLFDLVSKLDAEKVINILFITGLETSLYEYESIKREEGWDSWKIYNYSWKDVPRILNHLNQQRERFRDNFDICFVFMLPSFAIDYFIHRAPDFFDWRSGLFKFPDENQRLQEVIQCNNSAGYSISGTLSTSSSHNNIYNWAEEEDDDDRDDIVRLENERYRRAIGYYQKC